MRSVAMTLLLLGGCFAVYDDDLPGVQPDWHTELEQRVDPSAGDVRGCVQTCAANASCFWFQDGASWVAECAEPVEGAVDGYLAQILARECMMLGPQDCSDQRGLQVCDRADEGYMRECAEFDGNFYCAQARGPCSDEGQCYQEGNEDVRCGVAPWMFEHINRHFEGRCAVEGWDEQDINEWLIGFTARRGRGSECGLAYCDEASLETACQPYMDGIRGASNLAYLQSTCGGIPSAPVQAQTCDWRECGGEAADWACQRQYFNRTATCDSGWCVLGEGRDKVYLNDRAHGGTVGSDARRGMQRCMDSCHDGELCTYNETNRNLDCVGCQSDDDCTLAEGGYGGVCIGGSCRMPCRPDGMTQGHACIGDERPNSGDDDPECYCVTPRHGGGGHEPNRRCGEGEGGCPEGQNCWEIGADDQQRAYCAQADCDDGDGCPRGFFCNDGRCEFSGWCWENDNCSFVESLEGDCVPFIDNDSDGNPDRPLCVNPMSACQFDHDCHGDEKCVTGYCAVDPGRDVQNCDDFEGFPELVVGTCRQRLGRCAQAGLCRRQERCTEFGIWGESSEWHGYLCEPTGGCDPNDTASCPLGSVCFYENGSWGCAAEKQFCNPGAPEGQTGCDTQTEFCSKTTENERWTWYLSVRQCTQQSDCGNPANPAEVDCVGGLCAARSLHGDYDLPYGVCLPKGSVPEHNFCDRPGDCADDQYCTNGPFCVDLSAGCESIDDCSDAMRCEEDFCGVRANCAGGERSGFRGFCEDRPQDKSNGCVGATCRNTTTCLATELSAGSVHVGHVCGAGDGRCDEDVDCPTGLDCMNNSCRFRGFCENDQHCGMGLRCIPLDDPEVRYCASPCEVGVERSVAGFCLTTRREGTACVDPSVPLVGTCR